VLSQTTEFTVPMYSDLCWFVEGQATHNPPVLGFKFRAICKTPIGRFWRFRRMLPFNANSLFSRVCGFALNDSNQQNHPKIASIVSFAKASSIGFNC
jgi:hypothetical protein